MANLQNNRARAQRYITRLESEVKKSKSATARVAMRKEITKVQAAIDRSYKNYNTRLANQMLKSQSASSIGKAVLQGVAQGLDQKGTSIKSAKGNFQRARALGKTASRGMSERQYEKRALAAGRLSEAEALEILASVPGARGAQDVSNEKINKFFGEQIRLASQGRSSAFGRAHRETKGSKNPTGLQKSRIFYRSTQRYWEGSSIKDRNENIIKGLQQSGYDVKNLGEAWDVVMEKNNDALDAIRSSGGDMGGVVTDTDESLAFQRSVGQNPFISASPDWFDRVFIFS